MKPHSVVHLLAFTCFLVIGFTFSSRFYQPGEAHSSSSVKIVTTEAHSSIAAMENGQRSILLVSASELTTDHPQLESVWLVTYIPNATSIQLFPVFPSARQPASYFEQQLDQAFSLYNDGQSLVLNREFTRLLEKNNYWWSGYIIFDEVSQEKAFDLLGGIKMTGDGLPAHQVILPYVKGLDRPGASFSAQVSILQSMCRNFVEADPGIDLAQIARLVPTHILTDLDINQLQADLATLASSNHTPTCRFPTLEISRFEP